MEHKIFDNSGNSVKEGALKTYSKNFENFSRNFYRSIQFRFGTEISEILVE